MSDVRRQVNFRLTEEEAVKIEQKAQEACLSLSGYCKKIALEGKVKAPVITKDVGQLILPEISKIGSNINQIARKLNMGGAILPSEFREVQAEFQTLWAYVLEGKKPSKSDVQAEQLDTKEEHEGQKSELPSSSPSRPPVCEVCGAMLLVGRNKNGLPIWYCRNWKDSEKGKHTILEREE